MQDHFYHLWPNNGILFLPKFQPLDQGPASEGRLIAFWVLLRQQLLNDFLVSAVNAQLCHVIKNLKKMNGPIFQTFLKFVSKLAKILENWKKKKKKVILVKIWPKIGPIGTWMGHFSLKVSNLFGSNFKFPAAHLHQNQTWVPPFTRTPTNVTNLLWKLASNFLDWLK